MAKQNNTGKRYSEEQKQKILAFVEKEGRGGMSRAQEKFGVSYLTIRSWQKPVDKAKKIGRPAKADKPSQGAKKMGRPAKSPVNLESDLQALRTQVAQLSSRLSKIEIPKPKVELPKEEGPKTPKAKGKPAETAVVAQEPSQVASVVTVPPALSPEIGIPLQVVEAQQEVAPVKELALA